ncbi:uncharacterized protein LOC106646421, partial [Copidosoma floridanum]|uniref:uncharacterized protein LOC106646421 n=1 Tax=Copidosoma floridanum TaxID=29053 RepID=UPI0006C940F6
RAVSDFMYHGTSSTSSDISPMSEQKSLPRRGRSRWHVPSRILPPISVAETAFGAGQSSQQQRELGHHHHQQQEGTNTATSSELNDVDSLKKLKLGLRSSLWSRPAGQQANPNPSSDYSIAV